MAIYETKYKTENGKTRKVVKDAKASKSGAAGAVSGADNKNQTAGNTGKQGA